MTHSRYPLPSTLVSRFNHQQRATNRRSLAAFPWLLVGLFLGLMLTACNDSDDNWQQQTLAHIERISTKGWDDFTAQRLPKLMRTITHQPDKARSAWLQLALALQSHDQLEEAKPIFAYLLRTAGTNDPQKPAYRYFLASTQAATGELDKALATLDAGIEGLNDLDRIAFLLTKARLLMQHGRTNEATAALSEVEKISPHYPELLYRQATLALQSGDCQRAIDKLRLMLEYKPQLAQLYGPLASAYRLCGQTAKAEQATERQGEGKLAFENRFLRLVEQIGNPVKYLRGRVREATAMGNLAAALKLNSQLLRLMPNDPTNHLNQGSILYRMGRYGPAADAYRKGLAIQGDHPELLTNYGNALWQLGQTEAAKDAYEKALQADPRQQQARLNLASVLLQSGHGEESAAQYRSLLTIEPDNFLARAGLLDALIHSNHTNAALEQLTAWLKTSGDNTQTLILALKTLLQPEITPQQATSPWAQARLAPLPGKKQEPLATSPRAGQLVDLLALWRAKTGQAKDTEAVLSWWHSARERLKLPTDKTDEEALRDALTTLHNGLLPPPAQWLAGEKKS